MSEPRFIEIHGNGSLLPTYINACEIQGIEDKKAGCVLLLHHAMQPIQESAPDVLRMISEVWYDGTIPRDDFAMSQKWQGLPIGDGRPG